MAVRSINPERVERVIVRGANWVGDAVMTVPALRELRRVLPRAHVTLATRPWAEGVFDGADFIDELMVVDQGLGGLTEHLRQVRQLRAHSFDLALLFPNAFQPAFVAAAARVPFRVGYKTDGRGLLLTHPVEVPAWRGSRHEVFYYLHLVAELERLLYGESRVDFGHPRIGLSVSDERRDQARALLCRHGASLAQEDNGGGGANAAGSAGDCPLVALCPGSTNSRAKRWPAANFAALADALIERAGAEVLLVGSREEADVTAEVVSRMRQRPVVLTGRTTLAETLAVLSMVDLLVTNDTGPAHLAAALGRPVQVIFGPTDPATTRPFSPLAEVVRRPPDCAPCMLRDCPIDHRCMTAITPAEVFARAVEIIGADKTRRAVEGAAAAERDLELSAAEVEP